MGDLVKWYNACEKKKTLSVIELAALFHYRYIRIHPFEDGNGRIARLLVNLTGKIREIEETSKKQQKIPSDVPVNVSL